MSSRFARRLRREIAANPKKAGVLALLLVVAIWFWTPLMAKWFANPDAKTVPMKRVIVDHYGGPRS